jgi:hypothetical protein
MSQSPYRASDHSLSPVATVLAYLPTSVSRPHETSSAPSPPLDDVDTESPLRNVALAERYDHSIYAGGSDHREYRDTGSFIARGPAPPSPSPYPLDVPNQHRRGNNEREGDLMGHVPRRGELTPSVTNAIPIADTTTEHADRLVRYAMENSTAYPIATLVHRLCRLGEGTRGLEIAHSNTTDSPSVSPTDVTQDVQ